MNTSEQKSRVTLQRIQNGVEGFTTPHRATAFDARVSTKKGKQRTNNNPSKMQGNQAAHGAQILGGRHQEQPGPGSQRGSP